MCRWCCENEIHKVQEKALEIYWFKGINLLWDPRCQSWFAVYPMKCKYVNVFGCKIYGLKTRPDVCSNYICPYPEKTMKVYYPILRKASVNILRNKFGERYI